MENHRFASEKKLCKQILEDLGSTAADDACFIETVKASANQLFNFVEAINISRRSPAKLCKILDLHDSLLDLLPDIDDVFDSKPAESIRIQAPKILSRILMQFENAILRGMLSECEMDFAELDEQPSLALPLIWIIAILQFIRQI
ncbi:putative exocyst complex component Exo70, cullin repeat-like-containing domain superfamily [Helianthus annuus]|nr:putative exocyst complex component Exo70, cullin repeat-like-containing domain superfamily [Helianthus annuus]